VAFLGTTELKTLLSNNKIIDPFDDKRIKDAKDGKPEILNEKNKTIEINPGQFALLLSQEKVTIPKDKIAFISIKVSEKFKGLINVSGFHVDPGFAGQLIFSVYNAGPSKITLKKAEPYFLIWFSELKTELKPEDAYNEKNNSHQNQTGIPTRYIDALKRGELASPNVLLERIDNNDNKLERVIWAAGIIIALCIAICIKVWTDSSKFKEGYEIGVKEKTAIQEIKVAIQQSKIDSVILHRVDSILKLRVKEEDVKPK